ncbi:MAG: thiamine-phosphate kinase [Mariprofundales bacterium]|nr:thiamine-phosphate kinase [Mariprofundales bacterium]
MIERLFLSHAVVDEGVEVPNGDDASVHRLPVGASLVVSSDSALSGVHWPQDMALTPAADRAVQAALSDLAAMGATARWCWVALMAQDGVALEAMGQGVLHSVASSGAVLAGGDCVRSSCNGLTVTVAGTLDSGSAMRRDAAVAGDTIWLLGRVGAAVAGLRCWLAGARDGEWVDAFCGVRALLNDGAELRRYGVRCCIDISDGLVQDAGHIARASGVALQLDLDGLPDLEQLTTEFDDGLQLAMYGGEDYALLCTAPDGLSELLQSLGAVNIGVVITGSGVVVRWRGQDISIKEHGFDHFATV